MLTLRPSDARGHSDFGWLDSRHSFSFGGYFDPEQVGYRALRVLNDDRVLGGQGFGTHPHREMEILSYVVSGAMEHRDSLGTGSVIHAGELQRMTAGRGIAHSEFNHSPTEPLHFLQIWIEPEQAGLDPSYEQRLFQLGARRGDLVLLASRDGRDESLCVHQDVSLWGAHLGAGDEVPWALHPQRHGWIQVISGDIDVNDSELTLSRGDGLAVSAESELRLRARADSELLLFDLR